MARQRALSRQSGNVVWPRPGRRLLCVRHHHPQVHRRGRVRPRAIERALHLRCCCCLCTRTEKPAVCLSNYVCALVAGAAGALKKCQNQEWPLNGVSGFVLCVKFRACMSLCLTQQQHEPCHVQLRHARMLCVLCFHILFLAISVVLSVGTRHHKPPLCGGRASGRRGPGRGERRPRAGA